MTLQNGSLILFVAIMIRYLDKNLNFEIQFTYLIFAPPSLTSAGKRKIYSTCLKKENIAAPHGLYFLFLCSISLCNHQPLAMANPYHSFCHNFIRLGDGYRLIRGF
jgi:hypothetical protein